MHNLDMVDSAYLREDVPDFRAGDTVRVNVRVVEAGKERVQAFEGIVIARNGKGLGQTFTVRKVSYGVGVERIFPVHAPIVASIENLRRGDVRRLEAVLLARTDR